MRHAILGAGAIGGLIGTMLSSLGEDVTMIVRKKSLQGYPATLSLERPSGTVTAPAKAVATLQEPVDVLWISTKTYQLESALEAVQASPRCIVPLLNGVDHVALLRSRFGAQSVVPGTIAVEAEKEADGRFIQRSPVVRLNFAASGEALLGDIVSQLSKVGFACKFIANEQTLLWGKLCFLGPFALVSSASGMNIGEVLADSVWKQKLMSAIAEACAVANASGAELDATQIQATFNAAPPAMRSSMQKDLVAGRRLELDDIGGPIARGGKKFGIDVATTESLIAAIRAKAVAAPKGAI